MSCTCWSIQWPESKLNYTINTLFESKSRLPLNCNSRICNCNLTFKRLKTKQSGASERNKWSSTLSPITSLDPAHKRFNRRHISDCPLSLQCIASFYTLRHSCHHWNEEWKHRNQTSSGMRTWELAYSPPHGPYFLRLICEMHHRARKKAQNLACTVVSPVAYKICSKQPLPPPPAPPQIL